MQAVSFNIKHGNAFLHEYATLKIESIYEQSDRHSYHQSIPSILFKPFIHDCEGFFFKAS
ncbi:CLUMA_CG007738, isoform A [Clunio marinus]|uniref:CLUMA_CG007738, isoform A n=1 Tax=Clunio marinus TaxID=568069 RepID=A0A1J1I1K7_9DIPT|nr:CLUMA_CG007738, isoform A [Clunio marinus]